MCEGGQPTCLYKVPWTVIFLAHCLAQKLWQSCEDEKNSEKTTASSSPSAISLLDTWSIYITEKNHEKIPEELLLHAGL